MQGFFFSDLLRQELIPAVSTITGTSDAKRLPPHGQETLPLVLASGPGRDIWHFALIGFDLILLLFCGWILISAMATPLSFA